MVLGGLSSLQSRANDLTLLPAQRALYVETYQSGGQVLLLCLHSCYSSRHWDNLRAAACASGMCACVAIGRSLRCLLGMSGLA